MSERWISPPPGYDSAYAPRDTPTLTPYLTLPYILSLTWLAYPIISLLFVAFRLSISSASAEGSVADAKQNLLASCAAAEKAATVAASLPRYMALATNQQITDAVNGTMNAARATLVLSLTILEGVINFCIDIYRSTFFCFLELVVRGGLDVLISAVQEFNSFLSSTFSTIKSGIQDSITSINSAIQSAVNDINKVNPFGNVSAPQFNVPDLSALDNVTLPTDFTDALNKLNQSLPTLDQVRDSIQDFVDTPFEDLKADINNTFGGLSYNSSALFVPQQDTISFCGDMDTSVVDNLGHDIAQITKIGIILIVVLALLLIAAHCALEWYKWRCLQDHLRYTREAWVTDPTMSNNVGREGLPTLQMTDHNLLVLAGSQQHPLLMRIANQISGKLHLTHIQQTNLQWFFHYVFHPPALAIFLIGFLGLLSVELQLLAIHPLESKYNAQVTASVQDFSNTIATNINNSMYNQSATYANQINSQINSTQSTINDGVFGWVNGTTTTLNDTLVTFYSDVQNAVSTVFNGTVLENPMQEFIKCLIGTKIEALETALTFLNQNLRVDLPTMNETALVMSQSNVNEVATPISQAAVGDGSDNNSGLVAKIVNSYVASLKKERLMFGVFIALWGLVVLIAIGIILWHSYGRPALEARRRRRFLRQRGSLAVIPFGTGDSKVMADEKGNGQNNESQLPRTETFFNINLKTPTRSADDYKTHEPQRSWDNLLDHANQDQEQGASTGSQLKKKISRPMKLLPTGSKAGRERFISDEERARMREAEMAEEDDDERQGAGWMKRLTSVFHKKPVDDESADSNSLESGSGSGSRGRQRQRVRPNLTIATKFMNTSFNNISRDKLPTAGLSAPDQPSPQLKNVPGSRWSITPTAPDPGPSKVPAWVPNPLNITKKPSLNRSKMPGLPSSPRPQDAQTTLRAFPAFPVPSTDNVKVSGPAAPVRAATVTPAAQTPHSAHSVVPSYYHSNLPHYAGRESLLPANTLTLQPQNGTQRHFLDTIPSAGSGGPSGTGQNPFRTPFDDDARVIPENWPKPPGISTVNPFSDPSSGRAL